MKWRLVATYLVVMGTVLITVGGTMNITATIKLADGDVTALPLTGEQKNPHFKILNELDGEIYIGGKKMVVIYDPMGDITDSKIISFENGELNNPISCEAITRQDEVDKICQHYIRVAERVGDKNSTEFLFCGTNLLEPYCHYFNVLNQDSGMSVESLGNYSASGQVQFNVEQNSTALYYGDGLFTGYNIENRPNPSNIAKYAVTSDSLTELATTDDQNENFVNEPDFVGKPFVDGDFMYFFYRETAVEAVNQGKFVYSRVGRLCVDDTGFKMEFQTFFKARLNCSLQGYYPFYFNHIQDVIVEKTTDDVIFHAVFTTTPHGPASSAVCSYRLSAIKNVFETSKFKGKDSGKLPGPVDRPNYEDKFLECKINEIGPPEREFQQTNTLMDDLVPNYNQDDPTGDSHRPLLYSTRMNFYSIAVDDTIPSNKIYYIGTEYGTILKAYFFEGVLRTYEMEMVKMNRPVTGLHYNNEKLLAATEQGLYQINLASCASGCETECVEFRYGYCTSDGDMCHPNGNPNSGEINNAVTVQILSLNSSIITSCANRKVELTCEVKTTSPICGEVELNWWFKNEKLVQCNATACYGRDSTIAPFVEYQVISNQPHYKLVHLTISVFEETAVEFICSADENMTTFANVKVKMDDSLGCLTEASYDERSGTRDRLAFEHDAITNCVDEIESSQIMFQKCDTCPGNPLVNEL